MRRRTRIVIANTTTKVITLRIPFTRYPYEAVPPQIHPIIQIRSTINIRFHQLVVIKQPMVDGRSQKWKQWHCWMNWMMMTTTVFAVAMIRPSFPSQPHRSHLIFDLRYDTKKWTFRTKSQLDFNVWVKIIMPYCFAILIFICFIILCVCILYYSKCIYIYICLCPHLATTTAQQQLNFHWFHHMLASPPTQRPD